MIYSKTTPIKHDKFKSDMYHTNMKCRLFILFTVLGFSLQSLYSQILPYSENLVVEADSKKTLDNNQTAVVLRTDRRKAAVHLNGTYKGITPLAVTNLAPGYYFLRIEKNGFETIEKYIKVEAGISSSFYFTLEEPTETEL